MSKTPVKGLKTIIFCGILFYIKSNMRFTGKCTFVLAAKVIFRVSIGFCLRGGGDFSGQHGVIL